MPTCTTCKEDKTPDRFSDDKRKRSGLSSLCKDCVAERIRTWRQQNPNKVQAQLKQDRDRYAADPNATERSRIKARTWRAANPEAKRQEVAARRARKTRVTMGTISYKTLRTSHSDCYLCQLPLSGKTNYDHVYPLARGGAHCQDNILPTHAACNLRKSDKLLSELDWYSGPTDLGVRFHPVL